MDIIEEIKTTIAENPVVLFMKGSPDFPQCGFSAQTIQALKYAGLDETNLSAFDVLSNEEVRKAIKSYTNWPTIPQVFVRGQFIGGCDVVTEMAQKGELQELLKKDA